MPSSSANRKPAAKKGSARATDAGKFVRGLERGLNVLRAFDLSDTSLSNQEIARRTKLSEPTVTRLVYTLTKLGYLERAPDGSGSRLAALAVSLGYTAMAQHAIRRVARPLMQETADAVGAEVGLACRDGLGIVYLENCRSLSPYQLHIVPGTRLPLEITVVGHCYLAAISPAERQYLLGEMRARVGAEWAVLEGRIEASLHQVAERGYCVAREDWGMALSSLAIPLLLDDGQAPYVLDCAGPAAIFSQKRMEEVVAPRIIRLASGIRAALAGTVGKGFVQDAILAT